MCAKFGYGRVEKKGVQTDRQTDTAALYSRSFNGLGEFSRSVFPIQNYKYIIRPTVFVLKNLANY